HLIVRPPRTPHSPPFPYTTLFRSPNVRLGRGLPERHGEGGADARPEASGDDGGQLFVLHAADIRETPRGAIRGADSRVRQDVVAEAGVGLDPLGVEQRTRRNAEGRV